MSQVIIEIGTVPVMGRGEAFPGGDVNTKTEEVTSSATSQATTILGGEGEVCLVSNIGTDVIWVRFGGTASVANDHVVPADTSRAFSLVGSNLTVNVINDS